MPSIEKLGKEHIIRDLLWAEDERHRLKVGAHKYRIGSFIVYAIAIGILSKTWWAGVLVSLGALWHAFALVKKIKEHEYHMAVIRGGGFVVETDILSHIAQERIVEPHLEGLSRNKRMTRYRWVTFFYFNNCRFRQCYFSGYEWSREYYMSRKGLQNISIAGDEFYIVTRSTDHEVGQIYPKKFFEYEEN